MSMYHSVKCTKQEAMEFRKKVKDFLDAEKLPYNSIKSLRGYNGEVRIYSGNMTQRGRQRMGRKPMALKNPDGTVEDLYQTTNEPIPTIEYISMYRVDNWEEEKEAIRNYLKEVTP